MIQARSRALINLYLKAKFELIVFGEREKFVTDGKYDGGVDGYFIDEKKREIHIIQSKFRASAENFSSNDIKASDLIKMDGARIFKKGERFDENGNKYNAKIINNLVKDYQKIKDIANYNVKVILIGNNKYFTEKELSRLVEGYPVEQISHESAYKQLLFPVVNGTYYSDPDLTIEILYEDSLKHAEHKVDAEGIIATIFLFFVPTKEIGRIMNLYKNSILKFNPRSFLELKNNTVNKDIEKSIRSLKSNNFALYNNGVTMISDGTRISTDTAKRGIGQIVVKNPQLINGGQTAYTLATIYAECQKTNNYAMFKGKQVLLRVITFTEKKITNNPQQKNILISEISKASNSQTKVDESDRRSNDQIQLELQDNFFADHGLYYERKKGEFSDGLSAGYIDKSQLVDRTKIVRIALCAENKPHLAKSSVTKYFTQSGLSEILKKGKAATYVYGYETLGLIENKRREKALVKGDRYNTLKYGQGLRVGQYALLTTCLNFSLNSGLDPADGLQEILNEWKSFETWASRRGTNKAYKSEDSFDFTNYYKGATVSTDLMEYRPFRI